MEFQDLTDEQQAAVLARITISAAPDPDELAAAIEAVLAEET